MTSKRHIIQRENQDIKTRRILITIRINAIGVTSGYQLDLLIRLLSDILFLPLINLTYSTCIE